MAKSELEQPTQKLQVPMDEELIAGASIDVDLDGEGDADAFRSKHDAELPRSDDLLESGLPADELHRFEVLGELGRGGMASVHLVIDRRLERRLAMKVLSPEGGERLSAEQLERLRLRFVAEARVTARLDHPNIVPVYDMGVRPDGSPGFITMKLVEGETFAAWLDGLGEARLSSPALERVVDALLKICDALAFAHARGVLHCDLKPANVIVGSHGQVYVLDWGLAISRGAPTDERRGERAPLGHAILGTPAYMAPEQARGDLGALDDRTDVYGVGGILYRALTARPPHAGATVVETLKHARLGEVSPPEEVLGPRRMPVELCRIAMKALAASPGERYPTIQALRADLEAFLGGGGWMPTRRFAAGEVVIREGDVGDAAYIIVEGQCDVSKTVDGRTIPLRSLGPGDVFGETAVFSAGPRTATVVARTATVVKVVTAETLDLELSRNEWLRQFVKSVADRFREHDAELALVRSV